ncbi:MAG: DNA recombination protein RmuC [Bacilli bacterium]
METILIILISFVLLIAIASVVIGIILFIQFKNVSNHKINDTSLKEIGSLQAKVESLSTSLGKEIELSMTKSMNAINEQNLAITNANNEKLDKFQLSINKQMDDKFNGLNTKVDSKLSEINKKVEEKLSEGYTKTNQTMIDLRERLQKIDDAQKNLEGLSGDVTSLKQVLEGNQTRGQYGEFQLSAILNNVFGNTDGLYKEQYTIKEVKDGGENVRADAIVYTKDNHFICIDSKFPFSAYVKMQDAEDENEREKVRKEFVNAVKKHITDIKNKYIIANKTEPQALMFIPNDGVFAFIHHDCPEVVDYAMKSDVVITSPSTLQPILATLRMLRINYKRGEQIVEINKQLKRLGKDFEMFGREWDKFSNNLAQATKNKISLDNRVTKISGNFTKIANTSPMIEVEDEEEIIELEE